VNIAADMILLAKNIDAVYSDDPKTNPDAVRYEQLTTKEVVEKELKVMDLTAATICMENNMTIQVFGLAEEDSMLRAVCGEKIGTLIK
jgi:uridylate kinase